MSTTREEELMEYLKCKSCGGDLEIKNNGSLFKCLWCGSVQTLPNNNDAQRIRMFNRGNRFRMLAKYDDAIKTFENVIAMDDTDPEAHWCLALSRHGIAYVDGGNGRVPTCNRIGCETILEDVDYQDALRYSDPFKKQVYAEEAKKIAEVQRGIISTAKSVEPYDVFICFKDKDEHKERTEDSIIGQELYNRLSKEGYAVFFSRITLEDKPGIEYEPYIFSAIHSASVMIVVGTKGDYINSPWVRNEWSRYLTLAKEDNKKLIIPYIHNLDPDELPDELAMLQYFDHSKVGVIQDLLHVIEKNIKLVSAVDVRNTSDVNRSKINNMLHLCQQFLDEKKWDKARNMSEQILIEDSHIGMAYYFRLLADLCVSNDAELIKCAIEHSTDFFAGKEDKRRALKYGSPDLVEQLNRIEEAVKNGKKERIARINAEAKAAEKAKQVAMEQERRRQLEIAARYEHGAYLQRKYAALIYCKYGYHDRAFKFTRVDALYS